MRSKQVKPDYFIVMVFLIIGAVAFTGTAWSKGALPPPPKKEYCVVNSLTTPLFPYKNALHKGNEDLSLRMSIMESTTDQFVQDILPGQRKCIDITNLSINYTKLYYKNVRNIWRLLTDSRGGYHAYNERCDFHCTAEDENTSINIINCVEVPLP